MKKLSFVIPCYYSSKTILKVVEEILHETDKHQSFDYENIIQALYLNVAYLITAISVFYYSFNKAREKGTLINIGE